MFGRRFKIISTGWNCASVLEQTLRSVEDQTWEDWHVHIIDDASTDEEQRDKIADWCRLRDARWSYTFNSENRGVVRNQYDGVRAMNPDDEDVIVYLDLDGDRLAHSLVLEHLVDYYSDGTLVTYGSYRPSPDLEPDVPVPVFPFPDHVVHNNTYRTYIRERGAHFNHLRTVKWKVLKQVPASYHQWPDGTWLFTATDYTVMTSCLELAAGRYKCISEVLMYYNAAQPFPDNMRNPEETSRCGLYALSLPPLQPGEF